MTRPVIVDAGRRLQGVAHESVGQTGRPAAAVLWNGFGVGGRHIVQFAATMVLARVLTPQHFGAVGMVVVVAAFAATCADLGLGVALVQHRNLTSRHLDAAFWLTIAAGAVLTAALWTAAPAVAFFYDEPVLTPVTRALAFQFVLNGVGIVPRALLVRGVHFRTLALIELSAGFAAAGAAIFLALRGAGVWSLVAQILIATGVSAFLCAAFAGWRPRSIAGPRHLSDVASFSRNLIAFRAVNYWSRNADNLLVGRFLGAAPLGLYGLAYQLILLPLQQVTSIIGEVMVPVMARVRVDPAQVRLAFTRAVQAVALVLFPIMIGIVIVADEAIPVLFGDQWRAAVPVARVLAVGGCFQALGATVGWIYQSQGRSDVMFRWGLFATVVAVAGIVAGLPWGVVGVATGYTAAVVVLTPLSHHVAGRLIGMRVRDVLVGVKPALVATTIMAVTASLVRTVLLRSGQGDLVVFPGTAIAGIAVYVIALTVLRPVSFDVLGSLFTRPQRRP